MASFNFVDFTRAEPPAGPAGDDGNRNAAPQRVAL
jgi:hypothetical protein